MQEHPCRRTAAQAMGWEEGEGVNFDVILNEKETAQTCKSLPVGRSFSLQEKEGKLRKKAWLQTSF